MKAWYTIAELRRHMGCARSTAYDRVKRLEERSGRPVVVRRVVHGKSRMCVSSTDMVRAMRAMGGDEENPEFDEIRAKLEALVESHERLCRVVAELSGCVRGN